MLKYIEITTLDNAINQDFIYIHELVNVIKADKQVGSTYKKIWERVQIIRDEGRQEGREEGREEGIQEGKEAGKEDKMIELIRIKIGKGYSMETIGENLEEEISYIRELKKQLNL